MIGENTDADVVLAGDVFYDKDLAAAALAWLRGLDALVLIGDPARGFLDTSTLRQVASYRARADGDTSGAALHENSVFAFAECR